MEIVLGVILLVAAIFLVVAVLMQSGKNYNLSGSIAGAGETFYGKSKAKSYDKVLSKVTTIVAIVFVVIVILVYALQDNSASKKLYDDYVSGQASDTVTESASASDTGTAADTDTAADTAVTTAPEA